MNLRKLLKAKKVFIVESLILDMNFLDYLYRKSLKLALITTKQKFDPSYRLSNIPRNNSAVFENEIYRRHYKICNGYTEDWSALDTISGDEKD